MKRMLLIVLLLAGCSAQANEGNEGLDVTIEANKTQVEAFEPVTFTATVTHEGESVTGGAEIDFEFIDPQGKSIGSVTPTNNEDGTYSIETSFDALGIYTIISHVDYEGQHEMPEVELELK